MELVEVIGTLRDQYVYQQLMECLRQWIMHLNWSPVDTVEGHV